ncbi:unnamed protein product [Protopolystoma xenopodis]|uniref:Uncharacterized protein n=1 Tax=Protopolystoma xenopodis TaxID=117903 RepID=A0A3S5A0S5_9PLAT|nr:unnamed protein product [Protopolystoma xenopodis]
MRETEAQLLLIEIEDCDCLKVQKRAEKERRLAEYRALVARADQGRQRLLLLHYGWLPWLRLITHCRDQEERSVQSFRFHLQRRAFSRWLLETRNQNEARSRVADEFRERVLKRNCLLGLKQPRFIVYIYLASLSQLGYGYREGSGNRFLVA